MLSFTDTSHANPNNLKGEIKDFQTFKTITICGTEKLRNLKWVSTMLFCGTTDNSKRTTLKDELTDSSYAVVIAATIQPNALNGTISYQAVVANGQSCTIGVDTCANGWR